MATARVKGNQMQSSDHAYSQYSAEDLRTLCKRRGLAPSAAEDDMMNRLRCLDGQQKHAIPLLPPVAFHLAAFLLCCVFSHYSSEMLRSWIWESRDYWGYGFVAGWWPYLYWGVHVLSLSVWLGLWFLFYYWCSVVFRPLRDDLGSIEWRIRLDPATSVDELTAPDNAVPDNAGSPTENRQTTQLERAALEASRPQQPVQSAECGPDEPGMLGDLSQQQTELDGLGQGSPACRVEVERLQRECQSLQQKLAVADEKNAEQDAEITRQDAEITRQSEMLFRSLGKVWVFARIRGSTDHDKGLTQLDLGSPEDVSPSLLLPGGSSYEFDRVFRPSASNEDVYAYVRPMVQAALHGERVAIIADGPSGAGKSHTMFSGPSAIAERAGVQVFQWIESAEGQRQQTTITFSSFEVYQGEVWERREGKNPTKIVNSLSSTGLRPQDFQPTTIASLGDLHRAFKKAQQARHVASTNNNAQSSRGHTVCMLNLLRTGADHADHSTLFLVDLAGTERESDGRPNEVKERVSINKSRMALKDVIKLHLEGTDSHKLRNAVKSSPLTKLLGECFHHRSKLLIIAAVSPLAKDRSKNESTLDFTSEIRKAKPKVPKSSSS